MSEDEKSAQFVHCIDNYCVPTACRTRKSDSEIVTILRKVWSALTDPAGCKSMTCFTPF